MKKRQWNSLFLCILLFYSSLFSLAPKYIFNGLWIILVVSIIINNHFNKKDIVLIFIISILFLWHGGEGNLLKIKLELILTFFGKCYIFYYLLNKGIDGEKFYKIGWKIANISNFLLFINYFLLKNINYMAFGYRMLIVILIQYLYLVKSKRKIKIILLFPNILFLFIYGNRGASLTLIIFLLVEFYKKIKLKKICILLLVVFSLILRTKIDEIKYILTKVILFILTNFNLESYSVRKILIMLDRGLASSSSGRDKLYKLALQMGEENFLLGNGIGTYREIRGTYPHNLFLEIYVQFGIVGIIIFSLVIIKLLFKIKLKKEEEYSILIILFILSIPRLMLSSSLWERPEFWGAIGYLLYLSQERKKC